MRAIELQEIQNYLNQYWAGKNESKIVKLEREGKDNIEYLLYSFVYGIFVQEITILKRLLNRYRNTAVWIDGCGAGTELRIYIVDHSRQMRL
jgi:hypothetical protein